MNADILYLYHQLLAINEGIDLSTQAKTRLETDTLAPPK